MNPKIRLFSHTISDGNISMTIEGGSNFNNSDFPLYLMVGDTTWAMTLDDAIAIARAAKFIARRVLYAHKRGELARAGAVFRRKLQGEGGKPLVVELGLAEGGEVPDSNRVSGRGEQAAVGVEINVLVPPGPPSRPIADPPGVERAAFPSRRQLMNLEQI